MRRRERGDEADEPAAACPHCAAAIPATQLECPSCKNSLPYCVATGRHMVLGDWTTCPECTFPALASELTKVRRKPILSRSFHRAFRSFEMKGSLFCPVGSLYILSASQGSRLTGMQFGTGVGFSSAAMQMRVPANMQRHSLRTTRFTHLWRADSYAANLLLCSLNLSRFKLLQCIPLARRLQVQCHAKAAVEMT